MKTLIVLSTNNVIYDNINANLPKETLASVDITLATTAKEVENLKKMDIVVTDFNSIEQKPLDFVNSYLINHIISINYQISQAYNISLPLNLNELLTLLNSYIADNKFFTLINDQWLYNEKTGTVASSNTHIQLTAKEIAILNHLLTSENFTTTKQHISEAVWQGQYTKNSYTIESHLQRLKSKLPQDFLIRDGNNYKLQVKNLL